MNPFNWNDLFQKTKTVKTETCPDNFSQDFDTPQYSVKKKLHSPLEDTKNGSYAERYERFRSIAM